MNAEKIMTDMTGSDNVSSKVEEPRGDADEALRTALTAKLNAILSQPLTARSLLELEKSARLARELLVVGKDPQALQRSLMDTNTGALNIVSSPVAPYVSNFTDSDTNGVFYSNPYGGASSPKSETFGATVIRELIASLATLTSTKAAAANPMASTPFELVTVMALARERGMNDVADKLEKQLFEQMTASAVHAEADLSQETSADRLHTTPLVTASNGAHP